MAELADALDLGCNAIGLPQHCFIAQIGIPVRLHSSYSLRPAPLPALEAGV
jgi:hypothetical protein